MMSINRSFLFLLLLVSCWAYARGLYSWTDEDGVVHFGDRPPSAAESETARPFISPGSDFEFPLWSPGMEKTLRVPLAGNWAVISTDSSEIGQTVRVFALDDPDNFRLLLTVLRVQEARRTIEVTREEYFESLHPDLRRDLPDGAAGVQEAAVPGFQGYFVDVVDSKYLHAEPPRDEYRYTRIGRLHNDELAVVFTALDNERGARYERVLELIRKTRWLETAFNRAFREFQSLESDPPARARFMDRMTAVADSEALFLFSELLDHGYPGDAEISGEWVTLAAARGYRPALIKMVGQVVGLEPSKHSTNKPFDENRETVIVRRDGYLALTPTLAASMAATQKGDGFELAVQIVGTRSGGRFETHAGYLLFCSVVGRDFFEDGDIFLNLGDMLVDKEGFQTKSYVICSIVESLIPGQNLSWEKTLQLGELPFRLAKSRLAGSNFWYLVTNKDVIVFYL